MRMEVEGDYRDFILGGNASFILKSNKTGTEFMYKIKESNGVYLVNVSQGEGSWVYAGFIKDNYGKLEYIIGRKGRLLESNTKIKALMWALSHSNNKQITVYHLGKCGRCGRTLKDEESIKCGLGPECRKKRAKNK